ncbi:MAG TPA: hypothetical protein VGZ29_14555 [Terriglobia bacterium]|nr:hypothetical protein [Terriglobia bacterium]
MKVKLCCLTSLVLGLSATAGVSPAFAQHGPPPKPVVEPAPDPHMLNEFEARRFAQAVNRAESDYFAQHHAYATFEKLQSLHLFTGKRALPLPVASDGLVKDHYLRLLVSPDGRRYMLSLVPDPGGCGFGVFSDETGAVYTAPSLDCTE